ncbi:hypothetical protein UNSWDHB_2331 [Dehalobacter sp. UNSWDHB]|uniref:cell wall-binding repeat-containing protein n=1 Tax=Dehalobacter sp. UNSWDHB TaxID=1339256 RepID=UPI0003877C48|nr:cell wall-binding repeat-containing protein [Dehalobacter sp. UNSWDHB]EQB20271.1 hypothetical protein UNSWDHB_2331 [Dehalobacter sp. UNSWDHB]
MSRTKKIAVLAIIAMVLTLMPAAMFAATADSTRLSGAGRVETALDICSAGWSTASTVVLAPADQANLVDALAAAPLAGQENAPILVTPKASLDAAVKAKIAALGATKVYVIGAISDEVAAEVDAISGVSVETLKGIGRVGTANAVNAKLTSPAGTFVVGFDAVPDALSVASYAAKNKFAIVLANANGTVDSASLVGSTKYIVGGTAKVADIAGVTRISGADRFATNTAVASTLSFTYDRVYVANGLTCVDALAVAPLAAKYGAFVALASNTNVAAASVVSANLSSTSKVIAVGGTAAVSDAVVANVAYVVPGALAVTSITALNANEIQIVFNRSVDEAIAETVSNYQIAGGTAGATLTAFLAADTATLQSDKKTVIVKLDDVAPLAGVLAAGVLANKTAYTLSVTTAIKDTEGNALAKAYTTDVFFSDTVKPTVASVASQENGDVKITFSERIGTTPLVVINGTTIGAGAVSVNATNGKEVDVTSAGIVAAGLTLKNATSYGIIVSSAKDLGNYNTMDLYSGTFTYSIVSSAPYVKSVTVKDEKTLTVEYSEALAVVPAPTYTVLRGTTNVFVSSAPVAGTNKVELTLSSVADTLYAAGTTSSTLTVTVDTYKDLALNVGSKYTTTVVVTKDTTAPTLASAAYNYTPKTIVFTFSEGLAATAAATIEGKLTITNNATGVAQTVPAGCATAVLAGEKTVTLSNGAAPGLALPAGTYTFSFGSQLFVDQAIAANKSAAISTVVTITSSDAAKPTVAAAAEVVKDQFTVTFSEAVKGGVGVAGSATDVVNYKLNGVALPTGTVASLDAATQKVVTITMPAGSVAKTQTQVLTIANVQDLGGTAMDTADTTLTLTDSIAPTLVSAAVNADGAIILTFSEGFTGGTAPVAADLVITVNGTTATLAAPTVVAGEPTQYKVTSTDTSFATGTIVVKTAGVTLAKDAANNLLKINVSVTATR